MHQKKIVPTIIIKKIILKLRRSKTAGIFCSRIYDRLNSNNTGRFRIRNSIFVRVRRKLNNGEKIYRTYPEYGR